MNLLGQKSFEKERKIKLFFFLASIALIALLLISVNNLLVSFILSLATYYLLAPAVDFLERKGFSRLLGTAIPFAAMGLGLILAALVFSPELLEQIRSLQENQQKYVESAYSMIAQIEAWSSKFFRVIEMGGLKNDLQVFLTNWSVNFFQSLPSIFSQSITISIMVPFLSFFMLLDGRDFIRTLISIVPNNFFELTLNVHHQIGLQIGGFIRARLIESSIIGLVVWLGLLVIGVPYSLILGLFAAVMNIIPYIGPFIGLLPAVLIAFSQGSDISGMTPIFIVYGIAQIIDNAVLVPFLVARIVNLHPVVVILSFLVGAQFFGVLGMIICIPMVSTLKVISTSIYKHYTDFKA